MNMQVFIPIENKRVAKYVKSIASDLFGREVTRRDLEEIEDIIIKKIHKRIDDELYDIIKDALSEYFYVK
jgi:hypothetical protein